MRGSSIIAQTGLFEVAPANDMPVYRKTVLENGIRVVTETVPTARSLSIGLVVDCGSRHESDEGAGLAHLCEHLVFQGTSSRDALELARHIDSAGGHIGAFTSRDYTCYYASVLGEYCFHALDLLGDVILNSTFPEKNLEREKSAIVREIDGARDIPSQFAHDRMKGLAWRGHALGRPVAGTKEPVLRHSREDVIYFFHRHYTPDRMIIAAAGDLDHDDFVAQVRDAFWRLLGEAEGEASSEAVCEGGIEMTASACGQSYFSLGIPAPGYCYGDRYALHVLTHVIGGGISSRLFRVLRGDSGWVYDISADYQAYRDGGLLVIEGSSDPDDLAGVIQGVYEALRGIATWREPVDIEELWRAKNQLRALHLISSESVHTRMCRLATQELYFGRHFTHLEVAAEIEAVTRGAMQTAAGRLAGWLGRSCLAVAGPEDEAGWTRIRSAAGQFRSNFEKEKQAWL